eukprot:COSAG02_NODE_23021_length_732_cov_1.203791_1_plen_44_part_00
MTCDLTMPNLNDSVVWVLRAQGIARVWVKSVELHVGYVHPSEP